MQNNLKNSLQLIHYSNVQKVVCQIVDKDNGLIPDKQQAHQKTS